MLKTDLKNGLQKCVNFQINVLFIKIFANKLKKRNRNKSTFKLSFRDLHIVLTMKLKYNNNFINRKTDINL